MRDNWGYTKTSKKGNHRKIIIDKWKIKQVIRGSYMSCHFIRAFDEFNKFH